MRRQRPPARHQQHVRIAQQLPGSEGPVGQRRHRERQVETALFDGRDQRLIVVRLERPDAHAGPGAHEVAEQLRQNPRAHALEHPHPKLASGPRRVGGKVGLGRVQAGDDGVRVPHQQFASFGEVDHARAARTFDEPLSDQLLERGDLLADRRLGVAELAGGATEGTGLGDRLQCRQVPQLDLRPNISLHDY